MKDKQIMEELLLLLKGTCEVFVHGTQESSNKKVYEILKDTLEEILKMQHDVYLEMANYGWYTIENIKVSEITKTINKIKNKEA